MVRPAGTSRLDRITGPGWLAVGDAAAAYDPLSSYGMGSAMGSGYYAACAIADHLIGSEDSMAAYAHVMARAHQTCVDVLATSYAEERRFPDAQFWRRRQGELAAPATKRHQSG